MFSDSPWGDAEQVVADLFLAEIPEVAAGVIEMRALARTAGVRTKVAVASRDASLNAVSTFVGVGGVHMRRIGAALGDEIIDVVPWRDDPVQRVRIAVAPAHVVRIELDEAHMVAHVVLADDDAARRLVNDHRHRQLVNRFVAGRVELSIAGASA